MAPQRCSVWPQAHACGENNEGGSPARGSLPGGLAATLIHTISLFREQLILLHTENNFTISNTISPVILSPLTRGKPCGEGAPCVSEGLIPAHAGKTVRCVIPTRSATVHPRSRGENAPGIASASWFQGSSPLTRGKRRRRRTRLSSSGLIPTHAGKTTPVHLRFSGETAHPRSRGKTVDDGDQAIPRTGSSPLTRGKRSRRSGGRRRRRLIPAHAGKTGRSVVVMGLGPAHPRSRGENAGGAEPGDGGLGSSPLTRGKPSSPGLHPCGVGLIPAHAGKTGC